MKKSFFKKLALTVMLVATFTLGAVSLAGCSGAQEKVQVSGSSSVSPVMQKLAAAYEATHKKVKIIISTSDSSIGVANTINKVCDIGMASRALKTNEQGISATKICDDGVVLIVSKETAVTDVNSDQVFNLFANGTPIDTINAAISREEGSGTRDAFDGLIKNTAGKKLAEVVEFNKIVGIQSNTGAVMTEISTKNNTVGYISLGSLNDTVKSLMFDGVAANAANIKNGSYKLARPFNILTNDAKELSASAKGFIDFILSAAGQKVLTDSGYIAL